MTGTELRWSDHGEPVAVEWESRRYFRQGELRGIRYKVLTTDGALVGWFKRKGINARYAHKERPACFA